MVWFQVWQLIESKLERYYKRSYVKQYPRDRDQQFCLKQSARAFYDMPNKWATLEIQTFLCSADVSERQLLCFANWYVKNSRMTKITPSSSSTNNKHSELWGWHLIALWFRVTTLQTRKETFIHYRLFDLRETTQSSLVPVGCSLRSSFNRRHQNHISCQEQWAEAYHTQPTHQHRQRHAKCLPQHPWREI